MFKVLRAEPIKLLMTLPFSFLIASRWYPYIYKQHSQQDLSPCDSHFIKETNNLVNSNMITVTQVTKILDRHIS